ncbi:macrophage mannose receptor 1-like [Triplophysa dalaica]|uniref:macrophage mannose receptor 1-like n=1 Tax=Triplophysa dalaica TaxID=1582913 RepID=UPI0024DF4832|nr:macrophage mannose receptor 1-like [Triplophysa dalaica]
MKKMAQTLYFSLLVIALCSSSECSQRRYHYINIEKNWTEAQKYCRENYTDLATVNNINDMNELKNTVKNNQNFWIGLKNTDVYKWKWSLGDPVNYMKWKTKPSSVTNNCAVMRKAKWRQQDCNETSQFICYNENNKSHIIYTSTKTWREAQSFCRQYHTDLTSVRNQTDHQLIHNIINDPQISVWIGLFRDSWEWSDNTDSAFRYWRSSEPNYGPSPTGFCTEIIKNDEWKSQWNDAGCSKSQPFVCHDVIHKDSNSTMSEATPADNGTQENVNEADEKLILIEENLSWTEAVRYCRENHVDLVSVDSEKIQLWAAEVALEASTDSVWLGLRHSCSVGIWFWVNGEIVCYQNWAPGNETLVDDCEREVRSGAVQSGGRHLWISLPESKQLNFICSRYD